MTKRYLGWLLLLAVATMVSGCGGPAGREGTIPVSGTVTYNGAAVGGATVVFSPEADGAAASGITDDTGKYRLTTLQANDGAMPGKYRVMISKTIVDGPEMTPEEAQQTLSSGRPMIRPSEEMLPTKYKVPTSGLTAEVTAGGSNEFSFDLED